jgi:hypothetical protein
MLLLVRGLSLVAAFPSPETTPALTDAIPRSTFPACYFASPPTASTARSAESSTAKQFHLPGCFFASRPLRLPLPAPRLRLPRSLPFGIITPSGSKLHGICRRSARHPSSPFPVRSPRPVLLLGSAPDHRSRFVTFRKLAVPFPGGSGSVSENPKPKLFLF